MKDDRQEQEKNILVLSARIVGVPKFGETHDGRAVCDAELFIPNGRFRPFKMEASVFDALAYTRVSELAKGMEVLFVGHLRGYRTWQDYQTGRSHKSWFSGTGDILPVAGLPDLSLWPGDPLSVPPSTASVARAPVPEDDPPPAAVASETVDLAVARSADPATQDSASSPQLDLAGSRAGRYGDPWST